MLFTYVDRNPDWIVRTHEQLSQHPVTGMKELYERLGLKWTGAIEEQIKAQTGKGNPVAAPEGVVHQMTRDSAANTVLWKKTLTEEEIAHVREATRGLYERYYSEEDW